MSQAKAHSRYIRIPPRKARLAADLIRGKSVEEAIVQLTYCSLKAGGLIKKTLNSAIANAETLFNARRSELRVAEVRIDAGPVLKRAKSKAKGGKVPVMKRTSHITVILGHLETNSSTSG